MTTNNMENIQELVKKWYKERVVNQEEVDKKVKATLEYVKRFNEPEDGSWTVYAGDLVNGAHGQHTIRILLDEILNQGKRIFVNEMDLDTILEYYDEVSKAIADEYTKNTALHGEFWVGHNEADGSLGVFYSEEA